MRLLHTHETGYGQLKGNLREIDIYRGKVLSNKAAVALNKLQHTIA